MEVEGHVPHGCPTLLMIPHMYKNVFKFFHKNTFERYYFAVVFSFRATNIFL